MFVVILKGNGYNRRTSVNDSEKKIRQVYVRAQESLGKRMYLFIYTDAMKFLLLFIRIRQKYNEKKKGPNKEHIHKTWTNSGSQENRKIVLCHEGWHS